MFTLVLPAATASVELLLKLLNLFFRAARAVYMAAVAKTGHLISEALDTVTLIRVLVAHLKRLSWRVDTYAFDSK